MVIMGNAYFASFPMTGMTYAEALEQGYKPSGEKTAQPGYVSGKYAPELESPVYIGRGSRKGQFFILEQSGKRDRCYRVWLIKEKT